MSRIAEKFIKILAEKTEGKRGFVSGSKHMRNLFGLRNNYDCNIYYLTSSISDRHLKGFWNFSEKQLFELKTSKSNRGFVIVFLTAPDNGYLIYSGDIDKHTKDLPIAEERYIVREDYLRTKNVHTFRTVDEFIDLLFPYQKQ